MTAGKSLTRAAHRASERVRWGVRRMASQLHRAVGGVPKTLGSPIFIVGCGHSGTTLLLAILSCHSAVYAVPYESGMAHRSANDIDWFIRQFNKAAASADQQRWVEKTPSHVRRIGFLLERFPDARVILMVRDGRDVACSLHVRFGDFQKGVERWLNDNDVADPWKGHPAVHMLRYEDLIAERETTLRTLTDFLDLPFEAGLLEHERGSFQFLGRFQGHREFRRQLQEVPDAPESPEGEGHRRYRSRQAAKPVFDGRGRWRHQMTPEQMEIFKEIIGDLLVTYGYETDGDKLHQ